MQYCVTKSKAAFLMSAQRMFEYYPNSVFFWTFTWKHVMPDWRYYYSYDKFMHNLCHFLGNTLYGLRVWEIHPGFYSHGLHCHALLNRRISIHIVNRFAKKYGLGRCNVKKADIDTAFYLSKYMTKDSGLSEGMRQWGTIGGFKSVKVNDIEIDSQLTRNIKWIQKNIMVRQLGYAFFIYINAQTMKYGRVQDWPLKKLRCVTKYSAECKRVKDIIAQENDRQYAIDEEKRLHRITAHPIEKSIRLKKWRVYGTQQMDIIVE